MQVQHTCSLAEPATQALVLVSVSVLAVAL
jgi:hypothetical protein